MDKLHEFVAGHYKAYIVVAMGVSKSMALIVNAGASRVRVPDTITQGIPTCTLQEAETIFFETRVEKYSTLVPTETAEPEGSTPT